MEPLALQLSPPSLQSSSSRIIIIVTTISIMSIMLHLHDVPIMLHLHDVSTRLFVIQHSQPSILGKLADLDRQVVQGSRGQTCERTKCWLQKKKKNGGGGGGDADVDDGEDCDKNR